MNEIIVGVDDSATARTAAKQAAELATKFDRPLHLVRALSRSSGHEVRGGAESWHSDSVTLAEQSLAALAGELNATTPVSHAVVMKDPAKALCEEAERLGAFVIVVGNKRVQGAARVLGAIATDVARHAPCSVFIVHTT